MCLGAGETDGRSTCGRHFARRGSWIAPETANLEQAETGVEEIVIDLSGLNFIDCAGLHQLMEAAQRSKSRGGRLKLVKGPHQVHRVFALTGLDSAFDFVPAPPG